MQNLASDMSGCSTTLEREVSSREIGDMVMERLAIAGSGRDVRSLRSIKHLSTPRQFKEIVICVRKKAKP